MMSECYESSSAQKRLFLLRQLSDDSTIYNLPYFMKVHGKIDVYRFEQAFAKLIQRHEALRTGFEYQKGEILQTGISRGRLFYQI